MSEETIFHEVDEALRRDRMHGAWRRYGPWVIAAAVGVVLLVAANEGWTWWQSSNSARTSDEFYAALDLANGGDIAGAEKALDTVIATGTGQYPMLAKFKQAGLLAKQGKKDEAVAAFDAIATAESNQRLKELALLLGANALVDKGDVNAVKSHIEGLLAADNPLRNSARETLGLAQYKAGDLNGARDSFMAVVNDPLTASDVRSRMELYIAELISLGATPAATEAQATTAAGAAAAAVKAIGAGAAPAPAANDNAAGAAPAATDTSAPTGVESAQPATPDSALDLAVPAAPATPAPTTDQPMLSTGAGLPAPTNAAPAPATTPATTPASPDASATQPAPATSTTTQPAPAAGTTSQ